MSDLQENLQFQIVASAGLLAFHQARFSLLDGVSSNVEYSFKDSSKALMLSLLNNLMMWNKEAYAALESSPIPNDYAVANLVDSFGRSLSSAVKKSQTRYNLIDGQTAIMFTVIISRYQVLIESKLRKILGSNRILAFSDLNNFLIQFMYHLFRFLHELDYMINSQSRGTDFEPFISIDDLDLNFFIDNKESTALIRLKTYMETNLLTETDLCLKLYVEKNVLSSDYRLNAALETTMDSIESKGINIICIL